MSVFGVGGIRAPRGHQPALPVGWCLGFVVACGGLFGRPVAAPAAAVEPPAVQAEAQAEAPPGGRDARRRLAASLPLETFAPAHRALVERSIASATLHRHLPTETVTCDGPLLEFVLTKPEALVDVWRVLGISRLQLDPAGPEQWRLADGYGTVGIVRLVHAAQDARGGLVVFHARGGYTGSLSPRPLTGSCLVVVRHAPTTADPVGRARHTVEIDALLDVDGLGLEIVTRTLQPLITRSAAANLHEICLFVTQFSAAARRNPAAVARLAARMPRTSPEDRRQLVARACGTTVATVDADAETTDRVRTELAARWLSAEQLDAVQRP